MRARSDPGSQLMSLVLGDVVDGDVLRVVVVPDGPLRTYRWQPLKIVMDGGEWVNHSRAPASQGLSPAFTMFFPQQKDRCSRT